MDNKDWYVDTTRTELIETLHMDYVLGAYDGDKLIAIATFIDNRNCNRNLGKKFGGKPLECYTFDAVFVHKDYRGLGLHQAFIEIAKEQAKIDGAKSIWCTVSVNNLYSYNNFIKQGFEVFKEGIEMYGGHIRDVLKLDL